MDKSYKSKIKESTLPNLDKKFVSFLLEEQKKRVQKDFTTKSTD